MDNSVNKQLEVLYKAHYNAREASDLTGIKYYDVATIFRMLKRNQLQKYNRLNLITPSEMETLQHADSRQD